MPKMKKIRINLLTRIIIAIALGILLAPLMPVWAGRVFSTFSGIFGNFLGFSIPLIILGLVAPAIGRMGASAGRILLLTVALAYGSTLFSGFFTYFTCDAVFPHLLTEGSIDEITQAPDAFPAYFGIAMPPLMEVMTALILAFVLGIGFTAIKGTALLEATEDFAGIINKLISKVIIPVLPFYIFCIFLSMSASGQVAGIVKVFIKVIAVIFVLHVLLLFVQFTVAGLVSRRNPFKLLRTMLPAYATALGTQSSAATIPVTLEQTLKNGVSEPVARFVIPLCATIHLAGSTMKITSCAMAIMIITGMPYDFGLFAGFIFMLGVTMVAAPGVPGGAIMAALGVLQSMLGFNETACALMIALYIAMDSFGTACNVTGDGAIAVITDRISRKKSNSEPDTGRTDKNTAPAF